MNKDSVSKLIVISLIIIVKIVMGVVVPSFLLSYGLAFISIDVPSNVIGTFIIALWLVYIFLFHKK